jgi:hypothetical protein
MVLHNSKIKKKKFNIKSIELNILFKIMPPKPELCIYIVDRRMNTYLHG